MKNKNPFRKEWFVLSLSFIIMILINLIWINIWNSVSTILLAYTLATFFASLLISGGNGIVHFKFSGNTKAKPHSYGYVVFFISILLGTIITNAISKDMIIWLSKYSTAFWIMFANLIIILGIYFDFWLCFKERK